MSRTENANPNNAPVNDRCITCLCPFGIQVERIPCKCINVKCGRHFCAQCVNQIRIYNGNDRSFRCMYCLQEYSNNSLPEENQLLIKQLWNESMIKYDIKRTQDFLIEGCTSDDLSFDIDCRRRHLMNLVSLYKRFCGRSQFLLSTEYMINQLTSLVQFMKQNQNDQLYECTNSYRRLISTTMDENDIGLQYISLCERLQLEISEAEYCSMFPKTHIKMTEWLREQGSADEFQPKILHLFQVIEEDLINQWSNPYLTARTKIGVIGYTSTGKSSLINRLLGVQRLTEDSAAPVSNHKGTYFPLQFDRREPLVSPDDQEKKTFVTLVDIQGVEKEEDNYLDEIHKADCDIYMLVYDEELRGEQQEWISYIEEGLKRKCVLVRSRVDINYLAKFKELSGLEFAKSKRDQRKQFEQTIIEQLRTDNSIESRSVYLVACDYMPQSNDAHLLLEEQEFDFSKLFNELSRLSFNTCSSRIHGLANRTIARAINTSFRRGYVLNVLKYKVAAGFASIIPFGDQLPRYLSRDSIRDSFGINEALFQYLTQFHLIIYNYKLQTSVFEKCVEIKELRNNSKFDAKWIGRTAGTVLVVGGGFTDDIVRVVAPTVTVLSGAARAVLTAATIGIGLIISAGVSAWSAIDSGKHIFSYINRICDDTIMVTNALILSIIEREQEKVFGKNQSTVSITNNMQDEE